MRRSRYFVPTLKEDPAEAQLVSHKLMMRAGLIRKTASGVYLWLPLGIAALRRVESIVREEMVRAGAQEIVCSIIVPRELFDETGRWEKYGEEMFRLTDRHEREFCLGPTHEEVFTDLVRTHLSSYRDLPVTLFQIGKKYRDEIRPRFGVMRGREFLMKDAYSFDVDEEGLRKSYNAMVAAYHRIFERLGLDYAMVAADSGTIGGEVSYEFMVKADAGEAEIVTCTSDTCSYAANIEKARCVAGDGQPLETMGPRREVATPKVTTIEAVAAFLSKPTSEVLKTLLYMAGDRMLAILLRGDHELSLVKLGNLLGDAPLRPATPEEIEKATGGPVGFSGPIGLSKDVRVIGDLAVRGLSNCVAGANKADTHLVNVNYGRDFQLTEWADLRNAVAGDPCPECKQPVKLIRGIEVGHVFQLGTVYSSKMKASFQAADGSAKSYVMGCYGIGVDRTLAAIIEQHHDERGIVWPVSAAPFQVCLVGLDVHKEGVEDASRALYDSLTTLGLSVLWDDRDERAGFKFKDSELLGIPVRVTVSARNMAAGEVEITTRRSMKTERVKVDQAVATVQKLLGELTATA